MHDLVGCVVYKGKVIQGSIDRWMVAQQRGANFVHFHTLLGACRCVSVHKSTSRTVSFLTYTCIHTSIHTKREFLRCLAVCSVRPTHNSCPVMQICTEQESPLACQELKRTIFWAAGSPNM